MKKYMITYAIIFALTIAVPILVCLITKQSGSGKELADIFNRSSCIAPIPPDLYRLFS